MNIAANRSSAGFLELLLAVAMLGGLTALMLPGMIGLG